MPDAAPPPDPMPAPPAPETAWLPVQASSRIARNGLVVLVLLVLGAATAIAFTSALKIVEVWFEFQYVPIARAVLAVAVGLLSIFVLRILLRRPA